VRINTRHYVIFSGCANEHARRSDSQGVRMNTRYYVISLGCANEHARRLDS